MQTLNGGGVLGPLCYMYKLITIVDYKQVSYQSLQQLPVAGNAKMCVGQTQNFPTDCYSPHPQWRMGTTMPQGAINMPSTKKMSRDSPNYWCPTDVKYVMNYLLTITERGQQRPRVIR